MKKEKLLKNSEFVLKSSINSIIGDRRRNLNISESDLRQTLDD